MREEFFAIPPKPRGDVLNLLITGGSQGSRTLNQAARESWPLFREAGLPVRIVHQTGRVGVRGDCATSSRSPGWRARSSASSPTCRRRSRRPTWSSAGRARARCRSWRRRASPSVLVPFPFAADDHQTRNAEAMERGGAARLVRDAEMNGEQLFAIVSELAATPGELERMAEAARQFAQAGRRAARGGCSRRSREIVQLTIATQAETIR